MAVTKPSERWTSAGGATSTSGSSASFFKVSNFYEESAAWTVFQANRYVLGPQGPCLACYLYVQLVLGEGKAYTRPVRNAIIPSKADYGCACVAHQPHQTSK